MKLTTVAALVLAFVPALAVPPPDFGFPEAPNDTVLSVAFRQDSSTLGYVTVTPGELFGSGIATYSPVLGVNVTAYQALANYTGNYIVMMVDPDASYPENPTNRFILHWMQPNMTQSINVTISSNLTLIGHQLVNSSASLVSYNPPRPPTNSSAHRYILYAFHQPANFSIPSQWSGLSAQNRSRFNLTNFIRDTNLGTPAAANYFYVSNQTSVPTNFTAAAGGSYPSGNGVAVTSGDPYRPTSTPAASSSGGSASSASSAAGAAMITGLGGLVGAGLVGLAALM